MRFIRFLLVALLLFAGCTVSSEPPAAQPAPLNNYLTPYFWHDDARKVGCWVYAGGTARGISCLPDSEYTQ